MQINNRWCLIQSFIGMTQAVLHTLYWKAWFLSCKSLVNKPIVHAYRLIMVACGESLQVKVRVQLRVLCLLSVTTQECLRCVLGAYY